MRVWRLLTRRRLPDAFTGEGSRLVGGRWNSPGVRVVYTSSTLALATLEYIVRTSLNLVPKDVHAIWADVPDNLATDTISIRRLPKTWRTYDPPVAALREIGDAWVARGKTAALRVPSAIVPSEFNLLLNPAHRAFRKIRIGKSQPVEFDPRLWSGRP